MPTLYQKADDMSILYNIEKFPSILGRYLGTGKPILFCLHMHVDVRIAEGNAVFIEGRLDGIHNVKIDGPIVFE
jgi:hypothetical protein